MYTGHYNILRMYMYVGYVCKVFAVGLYALQTVIISVH